MCEPYGSIVQYPQYVNDEPVTSIIQAAVGSSAVAEEQGLILPEKPVFVVPQGIVVGRHLHYAKMGNGHSETIGRIAPGARRRLPEDTKYESAWWNREVKLDGPFHGDAFDKEDALESCRIYANRSCLGHIQKLRQFLEATVKSTERPGAYFERAQHMLTRAGWLEFEKKLSYIFTSKSASLDTVYYNHAGKNQYVDPVLKALLGLTRKRQLLVPEWSDVPELW